MKEKLNKLNELIENTYPRTQMSKEDMETFFLLLAADSGNPLLGLQKNEKFDEIITADNPEIEKMGGMRILIDRLNRYADLKITLGAAIFIGLQIDNPGKAVVYAYYIRRKFNKSVTVTFKDLTDQDFFGWGMLSDQQINDIWDAQKLHTEEEREKAKEQLIGGSDNLLDYIKTWEK